MSRLHTPRIPSLRRRRGVTLVELMIALLISFLLVGAAAYLYLNTRESQRGLDSSANANDVGAFAMETISREVMSAGFFPARWSEPGKLATTGYEYVQVVPKAAGIAYQFGIYGCKGQRFDMDAGKCVAHGKDSRGDTLVISYFTLDPGNNGQRHDCTGANADKDTERNATTRIWGESGVSSDTKTPVAPLMVVNAFNLSDDVIEIEGRKSTQWSLSCRGNGNSGGYQPLVAGVDNLRFAYGLRPATGDSLSAERYVDADGVGVNWDRVVSVRVCLLVKAADSAGAKLANTSAGARTYVDCDGKTITQAAADNALYKTYTQTFGVRNHQTMTY